jgi:hypothetical protein
MNRLPQGWNLEPMVREAKRFRQLEITGKTQLNPMLGQFSIVMG